MATTRKKTWKTWTRKEEDRLIAMRIEGSTAAEIAAALGRTVASVRLRVQGLDTPRASRRWQQWLAALSDAAPEAVVARRMGVGISAVKHRKQRLRAAGFFIHAGPRTGKPCDFHAWGLAGHGAETSAKVQDDLGSTNYR